jgi:hypothetical protein
MGPRTSNASLRGTADRTFPAYAAARPITWIFVAFAILKTVADPDLWGHVRFGLDILRDHALTSVDPYSFTQDVPWVNHEWLSEMVMGIAFTAAGSMGLMVLKALLAASICALVAHALSHVADIVRWPALALVVWGTLSIAWTLRPQLWTLLLFAALCRILASKRHLLAVPLLFVLWVNVHGGWVVGLGVLFVWSACQLAEPAGHRPSIALLAVVTMLSVAGTWLNPYGWHLWEFIASTVRMSRIGIAEWAPVWRDSYGMTAQWTCGASFLVIVWWRRGRPGLPALAVVAMLAYASFAVNRLVPLFIEAAVLLLAPLLPIARSGAAPPRARTIADVAVLVIGVTTSVVTGVIPRCVAIQGFAAPDVVAAETLKASGGRGRVITWFNWGEYAIWHLSPDFKVSTDGRRETVYSMRTLEEQFDIAFGRQAGFEALERIKPEYVWLPYRFSRATAEWLRGHGYRIDIDTPLSFVAVRSDLPRVNPKPLISTGCFPGP